LRRSDARRLAVSAGGRKEKKWERVKGRSRRFVVVVARPGGRAHNLDGELCVYNAGRGGFVL